MSDNGGDGGHGWIYDETERRKRQRQLDAQREQLERERRRNLKELDRIIAEAVNPSRKGKSPAKPARRPEGDANADRLREQISTAERKIAALKSQADELRARKATRLEDDEEETIFLLMQH